MGFEKGRIRELAEMYPDLEEIVPPHRCKFIEDKFEILHFSIIK